MRLIVYLQAPSSALTASGDMNEPSRETEQGWGLLQAVEIAIGTCEAIFKKRDPADV
jgi:hypothetical protein